MTAGAVRRLTGRASKLAPLARSYLSLRLSAPRGAFAQAANAGRDSTRSTSGLRLAVGTGVSRRRLAAPATSLGPRLGSDGRALGSALIAGNSRRWAQSALPPFVVPSSFR